MLKQNISFLQGSIWSLVPFKVTFYGFTYVPLRFIDFVNAGISDFKNASQ